mgnify:CR=1 FL=1
MVFFMGLSNDIQFRISLNIGEWSEFFTKKFAGSHIFWYLCTDPEDNRQR